MVVAVFCKPGNELFKFMRFTNLQMPSPVNDVLAIWNFLKKDIYRREVHSRDLENQLFVYTGMVDDLCSCVTGIKEVFDEFFARLISISDDDGLRTFSERFTYEQ